MAMTRPSGVRVQRLGDDLLADERAVGVGGVDEVHALLDGGPDDAQRAVAGRPARPRRRGRAAAWRRSRGGGRAGPRRCEKVSLSCAVVMSGASTRTRAGVPGTVFDGGRWARSVVVRHGQTEWSRSGQHTGVTDLPLLPDGEDDGRRLGPVLAQRHIAHAFVSPLHPGPADRRAGRAAGRRGRQPRSTTDLVEVDYGALRGPDDEGDQRRAGPPLVAVDATARCPATTPGRDAWPRWPSGSTGCWPRRARCSTDGDVALVAHGHVLRILTARWLRPRPGGGRPVPAGDRPLRRARARARLAGADRAGTPAAPEVSAPRADDRLPAALGLLDRRLAGGPAGRTASPDRGRRPARSPRRPAARSRCPRPRRRRRAGGRGRSPPSAPCGRRRPGSSCTSALSSLTTSGRTAASSDRLDQPAPTSSRATRQPSDR